MRMAAALVLACLGGSLSAAVNPLPTRRSQQFIVHDVRSLTPPTSPFQPQSSAIVLSLDTLVLSADRIKRALCRELGISPRGGGEINLFLGRASESNQGISIVPRFFADGWQYRVDVPDRIEDVRLVRAIVQVLLMEFANRGAGLKSAEIPLWLNEGLSRHLLAAAGSSLIPDAVPTGTMLRTVLDLKGGDGLRETRQFLRSHPALSFTELSQLTPADLTGETSKVFQHSTHLLVNELARLPNGKAGLVKMLRSLPYFWNWEPAFLQAFHPRFERLLDVEKWWSVNALAANGRDPMQAWPADVCLQKLDETLLTSAEVRLATNLLPVRIQVTPQQIVADWSFEAQRPALQQILTQLDLLRVNCPVEVVPLIDGYRQTLRSYWQRRAESNSASLTKRQMALPARLLVGATVKQLDDLLRQREALRRTKAATTASASGGAPNGR